MRIRSPKPGTLQYLFVEYLNQREITFLFGIKKAVVRALITLSLTNHVRGEKHREGYVYYGITTLNGFPIEKELTPNVRVLADYPVFTKMVPGGEIQTVALENLKENQDLASLFHQKSDLTVPLKTAKFFTDRKEYLGVEDYEEIVVPQIRLGADLTTRRVFSTLFEKIKKGGSFNPGVVFLELSITQENNPFGPWVQERFDTHFVNSRDKLQESVEKTFPNPDWNTRILLEEGHPFSDQFEKIKFWMASIPIHIPKLVKRLNLFFSYFGGTFYLSLSLEKRRKKKEHVKWLLLNRRCIFPSQLVTI